MLNKTNILLNLLIIYGLLGNYAASQAQSTENNAFAVQYDNIKAERRGPPQEVIEACNNKTVGDSCEFEGRRSNKMSGVCQARKDNTLSCMPNRR